MLTDEQKKATVKMKHPHRPDEEPKEVANASPDLLALMNDGYVQVRPEQPTDAAAKVTAPEVQTSIPVPGRE